MRSELESEVAPVFRPELMEIKLWRRSVVSKIPSLGLLAGGGFRRFHAAVFSSVGGAAMSGFCA